MLVAQGDDANPDALRLAIKVNREQIVYKRTTIAAKGASKNEATGAQLASRRARAWSLEQKSRCVRVVVP